MQQHDVLLSLGFKENELRQLINKRLIEVIGSDYVICDPSLLYDVVILCLNKKVDPASLLIPPFATGFENDVAMFDTYITNEDYTMAKEVVEHIMTNIPSRGLQLLHKKLNTYFDDMDYILDESTYNNDVVTEGLHKIERRLVRQMEMYDYVNGLTTLEKLSKIYPMVQDTKFFYNVYEMLAIISDMKNDKQMISRDDKQQYVGELNVILNFLLCSSDYYRSEEVINRGLKREPKSIEWRVYSSLMEQIMYINKKNTDATMLRSIIDASVSGDIPGSFPEEALPMITKEQLKEIETTDIEEYDSHDYYSEYEDAYFVEHDYKKAKEMLLKHMKQEIIDGDSHNYNYLIDELNTLIKNEENGNDLTLYNQAAEQAFRCLEEEDYRTAGQYVVKMSNYLKIRTYRVFAMLGECCRQIGELEKAHQYYLTAFEGTIAPYDLENMMEVCYRVGDYDGVLNALARYNYYEPYSNVRVHYIASAAHYQLHMYDLSEEELNICKEILEEEDNLPIEFIEEKEAIKRAKNGKASTFDIDNYIEYSNSDADNEMAEFIEENYNHALEVIDNLEKEIKPAILSNKIEYILTVAKLLFQACDYDKGLELVYGIDPYLEESLISEEDQKRYTRIANNLKKL